MAVKWQRVWDGMGEYVRERREKFQELWSEIEENEERRGRTGRLLRV